MKVAILLLLLLGPLAAALLFYVLTIQSGDAGIGAAMLVMLALPVGLMLGVPYSKRHFG